MYWDAVYIKAEQIALLRVLFGFVPVLLYAIATKALSWQHARHAHHFIVMSLMATAVYYLFYAKGTVLLPSSVAGMLSGSIPLQLCLRLPLSAPGAAQCAISHRHYSGFSRRSDDSASVDCSDFRYPGNTLSAHRISVCRMLICLCAKIHQSPEAPCSGVDNISDRACRDFSLRLCRL
jgi:hypothetical protein